MSLCTGSVLALGFVVLNIVRLTKEGVGENLVFNFSLPHLCEAMPYFLYRFRLKRQFGENLAKHASYARRNA